MATTLPKPISLKLPMNGAILNNVILNGAILARVSSREQNDAGYSLPAQEKLLLEYCRSRGIEPVVVCSLSETASKSQQRKQFTRFMADLSVRGIKVLVAEKTDRITRSLKDAVMVDEWIEADAERQLHLVKDSLVLHRNSRSQEKLNWNLRVVLAKNYTDNLSEEVHKGRTEKFSQGIYPGRSKFGYKSSDAGRRKVHVIDPTYAPWVRMIFDLADKGVAVRRIVDELYALGLRTPTGRKVSKTNIHRYLGDPFYIGEMEWQGKRTAAIHEGIITRSQFDRVQERVTKPGQSLYRTYNHLFRGLILCNGCGGLITWEIHKGTNYGHCGHSRACGQKTWVREPDIEAQVEEALGCLVIRSPRLADWIKEALKESGRDEADFRSRSVTELTERIAAVDRKASLLYEDRLDGRIPPEMYDAKNRELTGERKALEAAVAEHSDGAHASRETGMALFEFSQQGRAAYAKADTDQKRDLLRLVFTKLTLDEGRLGYEYANAFAVLAKAVEATNSSRTAEKSLVGFPIFEPLGSGSGKQKTPHRDVLCTAWRDAWDAIRTSVNTKDRLNRFQNQISN